MNSITGITVPLELVVPVVLALVGAIGWIARRYDRMVDRALEQATEQKKEKRQAAIFLREALRERDPRLEPLSFDDESDVFNVEHDKDLMRVESMRPRPNKDRMSYEQERLVEQFVRGEEISTPPPSPPPRRRKG